MIEGNLRDAPFMDVMQIIVAGQKSGVLSLQRKGSRARIYFDRGRIEYAYLRPGIHLGEVLVRNELLTHLEVQTILLEQDSENPGTPLGVMAVQKGFITDDELRDAVRVQVLETLTELMAWSSGNFDFSERPKESSQVPTAHSMDAIAALMEAVKRLDEWTTKEIKSHMRFQKVDGTNPTQYTLPTGAWDVLGLLDGKRNVASVVAELEFPERQVYRVFQDLEEQGLIEQASVEMQDPLIVVYSPSEAMQRLMRLSLQRASLRVVTTAKSNALTELIDKYHPQALVIEDNDRGDGWEVVRTVRKQPAQGHLPILLLSSKDDASFLDKLRRPKAYTLKKPFLEIDFQQAIIKMIGRSL